MENLVLKFEPDEEQIICDASVKVEEEEPQEIISYQVDINVKQEKIEKYEVVELKDFQIVLQDAKVEFSGIKKGLYEMIDTEKKKICKDERKEEIVSQKIEIPVIAFKNPDKTSFNCKICSRNFITHHRFKIHTCIYCKICEKSFREMKSLQSHNDAFHNPNRLKYSCDYCERQICEKRELLTHIKESHLNEKKFRCDFCGKRFAVIGTLRHHMKAHRTLKIECKICGKKYFQKTLRNHLRYTHSEDVKCEMCGKVFKSQPSLNNHIKVFHERKFECKLCGKNFHRSIGLKEHSQLHVGNTLRCNLCNRYFASTHDLDYHLRSSKKCRKTSKTRRNVEKVVLDWILCEMCPKSFSSESSYQIHLSTVHKTSQTIKNFRNDRNNQMNVYLPTSEKIVKNKRK